MVQSVATAAGTDESASHAGQSNGRRPGCDLYDRQSRAHPDRETPIPGMQ